jgi:hypothetical protein
MHDWIKLHMSLRDHEVYSDPSARTVFLHLLLIADDDGKGVVSRFNTAVELRMKPSTFYVALKRCENKYELLHLKSNSKVTAFSLKNWDRYQSISSSNLAAKQQPDSSEITLYKGKRESKSKRITKVIGETPKAPVLATPREDRRNPLVNHVLEEFYRVYKFYPTDKKPRFVAQNLIQRIKTVTANRLGGELTQDRLLKGITAFFNWLQDQEEFEGIQKLETAKLKLNIFIEKLPRKEESAEQSN